MYNVHIFALARIKVKDVDAPNKKEATKKALHMADIEAFLKSDGCGSVERVDFADEIHGFLIDVVGDEEFNKTTFHRNDGEEAASGACMSCDQIAKPSISLKLLKAILYRENSCIAEEDVQGLMTAIRREASNERRGKKTALTEEED